MSVNYTCAKCSRVFEVSYDKPFDKIIPFVAGCPYEGCGGWGTRKLDISIREKILIYGFRRANVILSPTIKRLLDSISGDWESEE